MSWQRPRRPPPASDDEAASHRVFPRAELKPVSEVGASGSTVVQPAPRPDHSIRRRTLTHRQPALTAREQKVRRILMKELASMGLDYGPGGFNFAARKHLVYQLDPVFLDREIEAMEERLHREGLSRVSPPTFGAALRNNAHLTWADFWLWLPLCTLVAWNAFDKGTDFTVSLGLLSFLLPTSWLFSRWHDYVRFGISPSEYESLRRRLILFEALRELCDEPETEQSPELFAADDLISRITARELAAQRR